MKISPNRRLFWFLKDDKRMDHSNPSDLDMYIQQVITHGRTEDIKALFKNIDFLQFKKEFVKLSRFLPWEVRKFWEDAIGDH